ncbi:hypothetical protein AFE_2795 [Acidithiobacillus ferrooxidans ATCC 23270]|uniref:Uncharacterized protein n=1 Tax=Acidithiobacillus ferrooxidans (strain ATCC 23270 / DSM 14882 / CIP 104768 / NCIMB 8455) TaxID=243159 RepID=B7J8M0_ACIF2|nr:hypothetical protein AFE_2795 [Acidithiobacillus ferrooxidans ATCC 23270]
MNDQSRCVPAIEGEEHTENPRDARVILFTRNASH